LNSTIFRKYEFLRIGFEDGKFNLNIAVGGNRIWNDDITSGTRRPGSNGPDRTPGRNRKYGQHQPVGAAPFVIRTGTMFDNVSGITDEQRKRARKGYELLVGYVRKMHKAGISMTQIFKIATLNGARSIGLKDRGTIEPGMRADLVIWDENPLENPDALFGCKTVFRRGEVVNIDN